MKITVAIMAGGQSSRMGTDKAFVQLNGKPLIQHVIDRMAHIDESEVILITNRPQDYAHLGLPMYSDIYPNMGSLGGIYTAITAAANRFTLVVACDMPFINSDILDLMLSKAVDDVDIIVPRVDGYPQALHAMYSKACLMPIEQQLRNNRLKIIRFYDQMRVCYLDEADYLKHDPHGMSFCNINTPQDLEAIQNKRN